MTGDLPPQLQRHRGEMSGRRGHDGPPHLGTPGEEDIVEFLVQQGGVLLPAALHHGDIVPGEGLAQQSGQGGGGGGGVGRGLHHRGAARRHGGRQRTQRELERIVPGGHNKGRAVGLGVDESPGGELGQRRGHPPGTGPAVQLPPGLPQLGEDQGQLGLVALERGLVEVGLQRGEQFGLVSVYRLLQPGEHTPAEIRAPGGPAVEIAPLGGNDVIHRSVPPQDGQIPERRWGRRTGSEGPPARPRPSPPGGRPPRPVR